MRLCPVTAAVFWGTSDSFAEVSSHSKNKSELPAVLENDQINLVSLYPEVAVLVTTVAEVQFQCRLNVKQL